MSPLETIDSRIARYRLLLEELTALRNDLAGAVPEVPVPGKVPATDPRPARPVALPKLEVPDPGAAPAPLAGGYAPRSVYVLPILRVLGAASEPQSMDQIAQVIGKSPPYWSKPMKSSPWFEKSDPDSVAGVGRPILWQLSASGRRQFEAESSAGTANKGT